MNYQKIVAVVLIIGFTVLGANNLVSNQNQLHIQKLQVKSKNAELKTLELKYDNLQIELNKTDKNNQEQIKKLQEEKDKLEKERLRLEGELQAKRASKLQIASQSIPTSGTASASSGCLTWITGAGITDVANATWLINKESGCNPFARNVSSGACGVAQELPCGKSGCTLGDGACQVRWMNGYVLARYGSWASAVSFHRANNWY